MSDINQARSIIAELARKIRVRSLSIASFNLLLFSFVFLSLTQILSIELTYAVPATIFFFSIKLYFFINSKKYPSITVENLLEHINRTYSSYEEASQIILSNKDTILSNFIRNKVASQIINDKNKNTFRTLLPEFTWRKSASFALLLSVMTIWSTELSQLATFLMAKLSITESSLSEPSQEITQDSLISKTNNKLFIKSIHVTIEPPPYTQQPSIDTQQLDLNLLENSSVSWQLAFNKPVKSAFLIFSSSDPGSVPRIEKNLRSKLNSSSKLDTLKENGRTSASSTRIEMEHDVESGNFYSTRKIKTTQIYRIETFEILSKKNTGNELDTRQTIEQVFSISVAFDRAPKIKILSPKSNLTEIPKSVGAVKDKQHLLTAVVKDDFGISNVEIIASVAKGSGEAVKFRDKVLQFDHREVTVVRNGHASRYTKTWSFDELGMEPGDEVYLNVYASDNREPKHNTNKSSSLIFRWLDEDDTAISADGLRIGFVPEYFKSQRQIIIDTKELIQDQTDIEVAAFERRSVDLGQSQSDLKAKYGQFLGDEFGEGANNNIVSGQQHDEHATSYPSKLSSDTGLEEGKALIAKFVHNTESIEVGALSARDPKTWMKMAVAKMWQAELHLHLSKPKRALPFEEKAYKYLKLARKADRIYAKRLGFEPPPVTEKNRLTGDLTELKSRQLNKVGFQDFRSNQMINQLVFRIINQWQLNGQPPEADLDKTSLSLVEQLKSNLFVMAEARPALIKYAAITERILLAKRLNLINCDQCIEQLKTRLWLMMEPPNSLPNSAERSSLIDLETEVNYIIKIRDAISPALQSRNNADNNKQTESEFPEGSGA